MSTLSYTNIRHNNYKSQGWLNVVSTPDNKLWDNSRISRVKDYYNEKFEYIKTDQLVKYSDGSTEIPFLIGGYFDMYNKVIKNIKINIDQKEISSVELIIGGNTIDKIYNTDNKLFELLRYLYSIDDENVIPVYSISNNYLPIPRFHEIRVIVTLNNAFFGDLGMTYEQYRTPHKYSDFSWKGDMNNLDLLPNFEMLIKQQTCHEIQKEVVNKILTTDVYLNGASSHLILDFANKSIVEDNKVKNVMLNFDGVKIENVKPYRHTNYYIISLSKDRNDAVFDAKLPNCSFLNKISVYFDNVVDYEIVILKIYKIRANCLAHVSGMLSTPWWSYA